VIPIDPPLVDILLSGRHLIFKGSRRQLRRGGTRSRTRATTNGGTDCGTRGATDGYSCGTSNSRAGSGACDTAFGRVLDRVVSTRGKEAHE
jgi:hypothetical protein